eukprot:356295-Chlamydomonas_euryale.AAC.20
MVGRTVTHVEGDLHGERLDARRGYQRRRGPADFLRDRLEAAAAAVRCVLAVGGSFGGDALE